MLELQQWLYDKGRDYHKGLAIFKKLAIKPEQNGFFDTNKPSGIQINMLRKHLFNYARIHNIKPQKIVRVKPSTKQASKIVKQNHVPGKIVRPSIDKNPHVNYDELPDQLKDLYNENGRLMNQLKSIHARMKTLGTDKSLDAKRKEMADKIVETDAQVRQNWQIIDDHFNGKPVDKQTDIGEFTDLEKDRRIKANKNYIRRYHADDKKQDEVKKRMAELDQWGESYEKLIS